MRYPDDLEPVRFDDEAAAEAVSACRAAIEDLVGTQRARRQQANRARKEWRGAHREAFDANFAALGREAQGLINALQDLTAAIQRAELDATEENQQRARARRNYDEHVRPALLAEAEQRARFRPAR